jgi:hypothetical protein
MRHLRITCLTLLVSSLALSGCKNAAIHPTDPEIAIYVLFDVSGSTDSARIRGGYMRDLEKISNLLAQKGGTLRGDVIDSEALNTSTVPIDVTFPSYDPIFSTEKKHSEEVRTAKERLRNQVKSALDVQRPSTQSAIMASLEVAAKVLNGDQMSTARRKVLVVFSDMVEESPRYKFPHDTLTGSRIQAIVENERSGGRLPDLRGVSVWKAGASSEDLNDDRSRALQSFWVQYFKAAGADLERDHYGPALLNFRGLKQLCSLDPAVYSEE